ncbi:hypothetical protein DYH09_29660 [bacterium CPR1]|nr:hypothetical protein [bacterium CPR1]
MSCDSFTPRLGHQVSSVLDGADEDEVRALAAGAGLLFDDCQVFILWRNQPRNCWHSEIKLPEPLSAARLALFFEDVTLQGWFSRKSDEAVVDLLAAHDRERQQVQEAFQRIQKRFPSASLVDCPATLEWIAPSVYEPLAWGERETVMRVEPDSCDALLLLRPQGRDWAARMRKTRGEIRRLAEQGARESDTGATKESIRRHYHFLGGVGLSRFPGRKSRGTP